jgi:hypothetical protein
LDALVRLKDVRRALFALVLAACAPSSAPVTAPEVTPVTPPDAAPAPPVKATVRGCDLAVTLGPDKARIVLGEPVYLSFEVSTACASPLAVIDGGDYRNRYGRAESYKVGAVDASGTAIAPRDAGPNFGGLMGPRPITREKPFVKRLLLAHWIEFPRAGAYTISVDTTLHVGDDTADTAGKTPVPIHVTTTLEVAPASQGALGAVIDSLGKRAGAPATAQNYDDTEEAMRLLEMIEDDRVVPYFARVLDVGTSSLQIQAVWGLRPHGTRDAVDALKRALGMPGLELSAAQALAENPNPNAWDALWALRTNADANVRLTVLHALAKKDFPDEIARLRSFESDASPMVRGEATRYLRERK